MFASLFSLCAISSGQTMADARAKDVGDPPVSGTPGLLWWSAVMD